MQHQPMLFPPSVEELIPEGALVRVVDSIMDGMDVYCQALADKIGVMISTLSAFRVPTSFSIPEIYQA